MSEHDAPAAPAEAGGEPLLARWSRLKTVARARQTQPSPAATPPLAPEGLVEPPRSEPVQAESAATPPPAAAIELPDLDLLGQDSDFSAFLTPGVDAELRKRALRKLFHSPKFNVFDGLDTYRDDFTSFPALGDVVTSDMRYHLERAARELAARAETAVLHEPPAADPPAALAQEGPVDDARIEHVSPPEAAAGFTALPHATDAADRTPARNEDDAEHGPA